MALVTACLLQEEEHFLSEDLFLSKMLCLTNTNTNSLNLSTMCYLVFIKQKRNYTHAVNEKGYGLERMGVMKKVGPVLWTNYMLYVNKYLISN